MKRTEVRAVFNRGLVSRLALARVDLERVALSADVMENWRPRTLGSMTIRPGTAYRGTVPGAGVDIPFVYSNNDTAIIELTASALRVAVFGTDILSRPPVTATITNGAFTSDLTGWTDADASGATSDWNDNVLRLIGTGSSAAIRRQLVTCDNPGRLHALRVVVARGPLIIRIGSTEGGDEFFRQAVLRTGTHSLAFTPSGDFWVEFANSRTMPALVDSVAVEAAGALVLPTPWTTLDQMRGVRWQQVGDVVFCACEGLRPRRIERRPNGSWSVVEYDPEDGPFLVENTGSTRLTPSGIIGGITITSSARFFSLDMVGALLRLQSQGQRVRSDIADEVTFTGDIRVVGVEQARVFTISRSGTWTGTVTLQRSIGEPGTWVDVASYTTNGSVAFDDGLDNTEAFYRIGFKSGDYSSGSATLTLEYANGSITGVARIVAFSSATEVSAVVLKSLGGTDATERWSEGAWSDKNGWPSAVTLYEGRLWWFGAGRVWGSVSDGFDSFDPDFEGDAGPINRFLGDGAIERVNWALPLQRLLAGSEAAELSIRSTSFDEPITPTNFNVKDADTQGSARVPAVRAGKRGFFVQRSGTRVYEVAYDIQANDYGALEMTGLVPEVCEPGAVRMAVQRQPDTRLHVVLSDGSVALMVRDLAEDVLAWVKDATDGVVEDVCVLPGDIEDRVLWRVARTVGGATVRFREELAREDQCRGGLLSRVADAHVTHEGAAIWTLPGMEHLEGETVVVWADGRDAGTAVVADGRIVLPAAATRVCAGLGYRARWRSAKMAAELPSGNSLTQRSRIDHIGLVMVDTHAQGLRFGPSFDAMDDLPLVEKAETIEGEAVWDAYDNDMVEFPGEWSTDNRICLEANAPRPVTVLAAVLSIDRQTKG